MDRVFKFFLDMIQKHKQQEQQLTWDYIKLKTCSAKGNNQHLRGNLQNGWKYLQTIHLRNNSFPKYIRNSENSIAKI
jgi:hypothetical protein